MILGVSILLVIIGMAALWSLRSNKPRSGPFIVQLKKRDP